MSVKKPKKKKITKKDLLLVHKYTYLQSLNALVYYLSDLELVYTNGLKDTSIAKYDLEFLKDQIELIGNVYNALESSIESGQTIPKYATKIGVN